MDYKKAAETLIENVGGEKNIISIMSCFTRVRVELKDTGKVDEKKIKTGRQIHYRLYSAGTAMMSMTSSKNWYTSKRIQEVRIR